MIDNNITRTLDIASLIDTNPQIRLSQLSRNKFIDNLKQRFDDDEQILFLANFYCYLNYDDKDYIINLEKIWKWLGFSRIDACKTVLKKHFIKDTDYMIALHNLKKRKNDGGHNKETIVMNINTFKKLCLKANTKRADQIHNYYINLENVLNKILYEETTELRLLLEDTKTKLERYEKKPSTFGFDYIANKNGCVYLISDIAKPGHYKIGMANDAQKRLRNLNTSSSEKTLRMTYKVDTYHADLLEKTVHNILQPFNIRGRREWFYFIDDKELNYAIDILVRSNMFLEQFNIQSQQDFLNKTDNITNYVYANKIENEIDNTHVNEMNVYKLTAQNVAHKTGRYKGVSWCVEKEKWKAELKRDYITRFLGYYNNDIDGAKAYNNYALYLNETQNCNYSINDIDDINYKAVAQNIPELNRQKIQSEKTSHYNGVFYCKSRDTYYASIKYMTKSYHLGADNDETHCAKLYNKQAAYFNQIDTAVNYILNDDFDKTPENILKKKMQILKNKKSSQYRGVTWSRVNNNWRAVIVINKKQIHLGFYNIEIDAAIAYNRCAIEQNQIKKETGLKNPFKTNEI